MDGKQTVRRFVDEAVNGARDDVIDELLTFGGDRNAKLWGIEDTLDGFQQLGLDPCAAD